MANKLLKHLSFRLVVLLFMLGYVLVPHEGNYLDAAEWGIQAGLPLSCSASAYDLEVAQAPASSEENAELLHPEMFAVSEYHQSMPVVPISYLPYPLQIQSSKIPVRQNTFLGLPADEFPAPQTLTILQTTVLLI